MAGSGVGESISNKPVAAAEQPTVFPACRGCLFCQLAPSVVLGWGERASASKQKHENIQASHRRGERAVGEVDTPA